MDEFKAVNLLLEICEIFDAHKIVYWLDAGTLLGAVREGEFIPWDEDIDLGTWHENLPYLRLICENLKKMGFVVILEEHSLVAKKDGCKIDCALYQIVDKKAVMPLFIAHNWLSGNLSFLHDILLYGKEIETSEKSSAKEKIKIPIFAFLQMLPSSTKKKLSEICSSGIKKIGAHCFVYKVPIEYFTALSKIDFYGYSFNIPIKVDHYLTLRYGEKWRIPDRTWVWYKDVPLLAQKRASIEQS